MMRMKDGDVRQPSPPHPHPSPPQSPPRSPSSLTQQEKLLLTAKKEVEDAYHASFWSNVSATMERQGANKYPAAFVQKMFRGLEAAGKTDLDAAGNSTSETDGGNDDAVGKEEESGEGADGA